MGISDSAPTIVGGPSPVWNLWQSQRPRTCAETEMPRPEPGHFEVKAELLVADGGRSAGELLAGVLTEEGHAADDDNGDEGDHKRVLDGGCATLLEVGLAAGDEVLDFDEEL